jgi:hypothetical protein
MTGDVVSRHWFAWPGAALVLALCDAGWQGAGWPGAGWPGDNAVR